MLAFSTFASSFHYRLIVGVDVFRHRKQFFSLHLDEMPFYAEFISINWLSCQGNYLPINKFLYLRNKETQQLLQFIVNIKCNASMLCN